MYIKYYQKKQKEAKGLGIIQTFQVYQEKPLGYQPSKEQLQWQNAFKKVVA
jgi:phospholipid-translocating ATPase